MNTLQNIIMKSDEFRIKNFSNDKDLSSYRLVVDTPEDLKRIEKIIA